MAGRTVIRRGIAWALILAFSVSACASRNVAPIGAGGQPFRPEADERKIWAQAEKEEESILKRTKTYEDPLLEEYLTGLADRLLPENVRNAGGPGLKVGVIRDPTLNAFAMPNGRIYLHTGLLAKVENEAQLATVMGHELTHFTNRHALKFTRDVQNKQILYTVLGIAASIGIAVAAGSRAGQGDHIGAAVLSQTANAVLGLGLQLAAMASINGYGRDLEREADTEGLDRLVAAGYDPKEAPKVFKLLQSDGNDRGPIETFFFGSHPRLQERIETTTVLTRTKYAEAAAAAKAVTDTETFELRVRPVVRENANLDIRAGRFKLAQAQLDRVLKITPRDPIAHMYYGDLYRLQAQRAKAPAQKTELATMALESYERSVQLDPGLPDPFRQMGLLYYQQKDPAKAKAAFEKYLALKPDAGDAKRVKEYLVELDR